MWEPYNEYSSDHHYDNFNDGEYWPVSEDTITDPENLEKNEVMNKHVVTYLEIKHQDRLTGLLKDVDEASIENDVEMLQALKHKLVYAGKLLVSDCEEKLLEEDIVFRLGMQLNRIKHICNTAINKIQAESVNF